ncbi:type 1 fimbrial protein [Erwinia tracheiphila]|uniref:Fimbrial protein n=1 Tax=Erwinia tracheiphila TaxID=65700 RepID=A0A0M2KHH9_9GAMM|nr:fimbrial protein [Erwinia tracheiphila]EOS94462.1 fimbrial adhesin [Erwinia tracheiphila PSU-1]KKF36777.1 fimbrial protein [Erwinia tracheiphila]UIA88117.1 type 1 fimbrial protein [Erwinia tracheiphila]UIA96710.1 type 1 fimbrial protein [Erwinia tracheiphila]
MQSVNKFLQLTVPMFLISCLLISLSLKAATDCSSNSNDRCSIGVLFQGFYNDETCIVSINSGTYSETVFLPTISTSSLQKGGAEAGSKNFNITLQECPSDRTVSVTFVSNLSAADSTTGNLTNTTGEGYSKNVQVRIRKEDGAQILIDDSSSGQDYIIPSAGSDVTHQYTASYYANGDNAVSAGVLKSFAGVELVYK